MKAPADAHDAHVAGRLGVLWQRTLQLMLMMLAQNAPADAHDSCWPTWGSLAKTAPADADDAGRPGVLWQRTLADAHDAGRLGVLWQRPLQLMLMMLAGLGFFGKERSS